MNYILNKKIWSLPAVLLGFLISTMGLTSCEDDDNSNSPMSINSVYLEDAQATVTDRKVDFARLGQTIRLEGSGFTGVQKIHINGRSAYFNTALMTDNNIILNITRTTPTIDADPAMRNKIVLEKSGDNQLIYDFEIRSSSPSITSISHTMPKAGEVITLYGSGLQQTTKVTFPGNVAVTSGIVSDDEEGRFVIVTVPTGITTDGAVFVECANGGAYSPRYFNFKKGLLHNFDDVNNVAWTSGKVSDDLSAVLPATGNGPKSQGVYRSLNKDGDNMPANDVPVDVSRYWINNSVWASLISEAVIPWSTTTSQCAIQMDIYYEGEWNSGDIRFVVADGWGSSRYCMIYAPWVSNGSRVDVVNPGSWFTITLPFSDSDDFKDKDLAAVMDQIASASYKQAGPWFENGDINGVASQPTKLNVYIDNIRVVPLEVPAYSDFPE